MMSFKTIDFKSHSKNNSSAMIPEADATVKKRKSDLLLDTLMTMIQILHHAYVQIVKYLLVLVLSDCVQLMELR
jgi:hypothetical protein